MAFEPMAALGLTFEEPVDAYHMLSLVGFYPSLVQSFGKAIVQAVADRLKRNGDVDPPPVVIRRDLIRSCFDQQAFRAGVVERFQKTLQLDERYELITYAVWQQAQQDMREGRQGARGYAASEIRRMADFWWQAGFRDTDPHPSLQRRPRHAHADRGADGSNRRTSADDPHHRPQWRARSIRGRSTDSSAHRRILQRARRRRHASHHRAAEF